MIVTINGIKTTKTVYKNFTNYSVDGLTNYEYNLLRDGLYNKYNKVDGFIFQSLFKDYIQGYLQVKVKEA